MQLRCIGLVGGMSWHSTAWYYTQINRLSNERLGGLSTARVLIDSLDFGELDRLSNVEGRWNRVEDLLCASARRLQVSGADCVLLCANTAHLMAEAVAAAVTIPLLHIADSVASEAVKREFGHVALLGTHNVMNSPEFFLNRLGDIVSCVRLEPPEKLMLDELIRDELMHGRFSGAHVRDVQELGTILAARGLDAVVYACTELSVLMDGFTMPLAVLDAGRLHAIAAVEFALEDLP